MCYLVREHAAAAGQAAQPGREGPAQLRPRWAGAAAATLVGGLALAALLFPASLPPAVSASPPAAAVPLQTSLGAAPATPAGAQQTPMVDDGVPGTPEVAKAAYGGCHHGM